MSNRLTFSLASLIVLIAFGLVFAPTAVMAHSDAQRDSDNDGTIDVGVHTHPVETEIDADATADPPVLGVPPHNSHPMPMISLKPDAASATTEKVRGNMVVIGAAPTGGQTDAVDANEFVLVIDFDQDVVSASTFRNVAADTAAATALAATEFGGLVLNAVDGTIGSNLGSLTISAPTRVMNDNSKWEAVVLVGDTAVPNGTEDDPLESVRVRIRVTAGAVFSFETLPELTAVPGGASQASDVLEITLVNELMTVDSTKPAATITAPTMAETNGDLVFNIDFGEAVTGFGLGDVMVTNGTKADFSTKADGSFDVTITPDSADSRVTVSVAAGVAMDASMNANTAGTGTYSPDGYVSSVVLSSEDGTGDDDGKVIFTLDFDDVPNKFSVAALDVTNVALLSVSDLEMADMATEGYAATYMLTVTPTATATAVTLTIQAGAITTGMGAAEVDIDSAQLMHTLPTPDAPAAPAGLTATAGVQEVTLQWTVVEGATYQYRKKSGTATFMADGSDYMDIAAADLMAVTGDATMKMFDVTGLTGGMAYTFEVRVKASGMVPAGTAASAMATPMSPDAPVTSLDSVDFTSTTTAGVTTLTLTETDPLPNSGFGIVQTHNPTLPDIHRFFSEGGTISVLSSDSAAKLRDVVISEIMWGLNLRSIGDARTANQFIELYDTTGGGADLTKVSIVFDGANTVPAVPTGMVLLDQVSNVDGVGWLIGDAPGQSGRIALPDDVTTFVPLDLKSMYRKIDYAKVEKADHDADAAKNRTAQLKDFPNGNAIGSWAESNVADTYGVNLVGSPGAKHFVPYQPLTPTNVPRGTFVINEVGNHSNDAYDWVEIRRVGGDGNLKKWRLSQVTSDKKDTALVTFPDNDHHKINADGDVLLIVNSDPYQNPNHPLAAGINIKHNNGRAETTGVTSRYYVDSGLKLANSGKTLLILRNSNDNAHLGKSNNIQDVIGTLSITDNSAGFRTKLWPLVAKNAPHGDVITDGPPEELKSGSVYVRNDAAANNAQNPDGGSWEHDLSTVGYIGIGYKRSAAGNNQHGGTPGYANNARIDTDALADSAMISISEIMYAKNRNEPQWIELHNSSMTQAVNLNEWKLKIEHSRDADDIDIRTSVTTNNLGGNITIQPNQTVLIVSNTTGRTSRASQGGIDFPATRVINLWAQKDKLEIASGTTRLTYRLLSETAFKLTLLDKAGATVDVVGNLDAATAWDLPASENGEGRSSIIRRYTAGVPDDGTMEESWTFARDSHLTWVRFNETYYGSPDDIGTPGFRAGGPLPVSLSKFRPERLDNGSIRIVWITESELNNAGFNILRSDARDGEFKQINTKLIAGQGTTSERTTYTHVDTSAKPNVVYYYQIQDVSLDGKVQTLRLSRLKGHISPAGKITTTWGDIKALQ